MYHNFVRKYQLSNLTQDLLTESSGYLLDELFLDINAHFSDILTSKWQNSTDAIDTVCETLQASITYGQSDRDVTPC